MPDAYRFDHLPNWGALNHRCIDCGWPDPVRRPVSERERKAHFRQHERERKQAAEQRQRENLAKARRAKRLAERENALIEERVSQS